MEIQVKIDCTPEELRSFLGWPDVKPLQEEMLAHAARLMREGGEGIDALSLLRPLLAPNAQAFDAFQRAFMQGFAATAKKGEPPSG